MDAPDSRGLVPKTLQMPPLASITAMGDVPVATDVNHVSAACLDAEAWLVRRHGDAHADR